MEKLKQIMNLANLNLELMIFIILRLKGIYKRVIENLNF